jgi:hypothetical protein
LHDAVRLEAGEQERVDVLLQRNPVLQAEGHGNGEAVG